MDNKLPLCDEPNCLRVAGHVGEHSNQIEYREIKHHPFLEVAENFHQQTEVGRAIGFQIWTCDACGARQQMEEANRFYETGGCENCGFTTNLVRKGCNFMLMIPTKGTPRSVLVDVIKALGFKPPRDN